MSLFDEMKATGWFRDVEGEWQFVENGAIIYNEGGNYSEHAILDNEWRSLYGHCGHLCPHEIHKTPTGERNWSLPPRIARSKEEERTLVEQTALADFTWLRSND